MKEYLISAITLGIVAGIALHIAHKELLPSVKTAAGVVLLSFTVLPIGGILSGIPEIPLPSLDGGFYDGSIYEEGESAFALGVARAVAERFSVDEGDITVVCRGFSLEKLGCEHITLTLSGGAKRLDYRAVRDYIEENLEVGGCDVRIEG